MTRAGGALLLFLLAPPAGAQTTLETRICQGTPPVCASYQWAPVVTPPVIVVPPSPPVVVPPVVPPSPPPPPADTSPFPFPASCPPTSSDPTMRTTLVVTGTQLYAVHPRYGNPLPYGTHTCVGILAPGTRSYDGSTDVGGLMLWAPRETPPALLRCVLLNGRHCP